MEDSKGKEVGVSLLITCAKTDFQHNRYQIIKYFEHKSFDMPTYYYINKHRPKLVKGIYDINPKYRYLARESNLKKFSRNDVSDAKKNKIPKNYFARIDCSLAEGITLILQKYERVLDA